VGSVLHWCCLGRKCFVFVLILSDSIQLEQPLIRPSRLFHPRAGRCAGSATGEPWFARHPGCDLGRVFAIEARTARRDSALRQVVERLVRYRHSVSSTSTTNTTLLDDVRPEIDRTIRDLKLVEFKPDPIVEKDSLRAVNVVSSAFKRHGFILELGILKRLKQCPDFIVWSEGQFQIYPEVDRADESDHREFQYGQTGRPLQIDAFVFNKKSRKLSAYEFKRGNAYHDAGKRRSMVRDAKSIRLLLKSYGASRDLMPNEVSSHIVFYYGKMSVKPPIGISGRELDEHFGWPIYDEVEVLNAYFKGRLADLLKHLFAD
jgi:hypothetical protein